MTNIQPHRLSRSRFLACAFLAVTLCGGCAGRGRDSSVVTMFHYVETGRQATTRYLERAGNEDLARGMDRARSATVRVRAVVERRGSRVLSQEGSGVHVGDGLVLTAGHVVPKRAAATYVTFLDGLMRPARVVVRELPKEDPKREWVLLRADSLEDARTDSVSVGEPEVGSIVSVVGYPDTIGVTRRGHLATAFDRETTPLAPVALLARIVGEPECLRLEPVAGYTPIVGMSGGPVVNQSGRVVAVVATLEDNGDLCANDLLTARSLVNDS